MLAFPTLSLASAQVPRNHFPFYRFILTSSPHILQHFPPCHATRQLLAFSSASSFGPFSIRANGTHLHECLSLSPYGPSSQPAAFCGGRDPSADDDSVDMSEALQDEAKVFSSDLVDVSVETIGKNKRRITVTISIEAPLEAVWNVLTDYEGLAEFLPGLAVCELQDRWENGARLFQIGEQNLALGLKFQAKGVINVHEHPLETLSCGFRRDIGFEMIEGDFEIFKGIWRMEQGLSTPENPKSHVADPIVQTTLSYILDVKPKIWLPVALVEGKLSKEIQCNLVCVRDQVLRCCTLWPIC